MRTSPTRGVLVTLDKERYLRYTLATIREIRKEFGEDVLETGMEQDAVGKLLWYGLKHEDARLTPEAIEEMVDLEHLSEVMDALVKALGGRAKVVPREQTGGLRLDPDPPPPVAEKPAVPAAGERSEMVAN